MPTAGNVFSAQNARSGQILLAKLPGRTAIPVKRLQAKIFFDNVPEPDRSEAKVRRLEFPNG